MGDALDDFDLDEMACEQTQGPAGVAFRRFGAGEPGDTGLHLAGDLYFARWLFPLLAIQGTERADFATADAKSFEGAGRHSSGQADLGVLERGTGRPLV